MTADARELPRLRGHYAGAVSRFVAYAADLGIISLLFGLACAAVSFAASLVGHPINWSRSDLPVAIAYGLWWFLYFAYSWAANGKTFGMALLGVRVVSTEGDVAGPRRAIVRALIFPLSFLLLGLGFVGILIDSERRALHDIVAGTTVVYTWDARAQKLHFLAREDAAQDDAARDDAARVPAQPGPPTPETSVTAPPS
jgi:uncharacterized RDD family membrane protein YckC